MLAIICLSAADAILTLEILARGGTEVNPLMALLLDISDSAFILGKLAITVVCLFIALVHINFRILKVFPMQHRSAAVAALLRPGQLPVDSAGRLDTHPCASG